MKEWMTVQVRSEGVSAMRKTKERCDGVRVIWNEGKESERAREDEREKEG
jgi:hypothetical protein